MAGLDELFAQIPMQEIASKLGADEGEVNNAIKRWCRRWSAACRERPGRRHRLDQPRVRRHPAGRQRPARRRGQRRPGRREAGRPVRREDLRRQRQQCRRVGAGRRRRGQQRSDQEAAADPGADRAGLHRQAVRQGRGPGGRQRPQAQAAPAAASATCWAASSAAPVAAAAGTTRSAASWAACSAVAGRSGQSDRRDPGRPAGRQEVARGWAGSQPAPAVAASYARTAFLEWLGDRQPHLIPPVRRLPCPSPGIRVRWRATCTRAGSTPATSTPTPPAASPPTRSCCRRRM